MARGINGETKIDPFDIVIIGGGLVGASLAVALAPARKKILVIESIPFDSSKQPSYDERTVALTHSAKLIFSGMGIWREMACDEVTPIQDIHISNRGHFGQTHLSCQQVGTDALGYVVPTRVIGKALWNAIEQCEYTTALSSSSAKTLQPDGDHCLIEINDSKGDRVVSARLVVIADGGRSTISKDLALNYNDQDYPQSAVLSIVTVDRAHKGRAFERFTDQGPLALLPHSATSYKTDRFDRYAVVWSTLNENVASVMALNDAEFIARLQITFGDRAGNFSNPSARKVYPLRRSQISHPGAGRIIIIGNAAHAVHPVAGQGFNLGLRDVATLAELVFNTPEPELGSDTMINRYLLSRKRDVMMVDRFTHSLISIFSNNNKPLTLARNLGLAFVEHSPLAKRFLLKRTMGLAGNQSRLAMGIPLSE